MILQISFLTVGPSLGLFKNPLCPGPVFQGIQDFSAYKCVTSVHAEVYSSWTVLTVPPGAAVSHWVSPDSTKCCSFPSGTSLLHEVLSIRQTPLDIKAKGGLGQSRNNILSPFISRLIRRAPSNTA